MTTRRQFLKDNYFVIDWETYYDKDCTIKGTTTWEYCKHERFHPYLVGLAWGGGKDESWAGDPREFDWGRLEGRIAVAHNRGFDYPVTLKAIEMGLMPDIEIKGWHDTSAMSCYLQLGRSLQDAMRGAFDEDMSKEVRDYMKGKTPEDIKAEGKWDDVVNYAKQDAVLEWRLLEHLYPQIPEIELELEDLTIRMGEEGVKICEPTVEAGIDKLEKALWEAKRNLPWYDQIDPDTKKPYVVYSQKALALECRKRGIPPPKSLAQGDKETEKWVAKYKDKLNFVADMQNYNRINKHLKTLKTMHDRINMHGRMPYSLMYFGAEVTGRWSGAGGFNMQNLPRDTKFGVNIRNCIKAPDGHSFIVSDLSQIEARLIWACVGDTESLDLVRKGYNPYEAHAINTMGWTGGKLKDEDPDLYLLAKTRVLQLGYGCGWHKFYETVQSFGQLKILEGEYALGDKKRFTNFLDSYQKKYLAWFNAADSITKKHWVNAFIQVMDYRDKNPKIVKKWREYDSEYKSRNDGDDMQIELMNGRLINFWNIREEKDQTKAKLQKGGGRRSNYYGANLFQNEVQANARNLFSEHMIEIDRLGYKIVMTVHDEVVVEVENEKLHQAKKDIKRIMTTPPTWCDIPLDSDTVIMERYTK